MKAKTSVWDRMGINTFLKEGFRLILIVWLWASQVIFRPFRFPVLNWETENDNYEEWITYENAQEMLSTMGDLEREWQLCLGHNGMGLGRHLYNSFFTANRTHIHSYNGVVWKGRCDPNTWVLDLGVSGAKAAQPCLCLGGPILTVNREGFPWTMIPRLPLPWEVPRPGWSWFSQF